MILSFTLSVPNRGSWNGGWNGEKDLFCLTKKFSTKKFKEKALEILNKRSFYYGWSDGWGASVNVEEVDSPTARKLNKQSKGFYGYNWMVDSIINKGYIEE